MKNEEIKEINLSEMLFNRDNKLLDYITNLQQKLEQYEKTQTYGDYVETVNKVVELQQENEILKELNICVGCENNPDYKSRCDDEVLKNAELKQENERLKEENEKLNKICMRIELPAHEHFSTINGTKIISRFCDETIVYKSRIDKAIEYIEENYPTSTINYQDDKYKLINILNGSDENG